MESVLKGNFIVINTYIKRIERLQINNLTLQLKEPQKEEQTKPKVNRRKEITKIRPEALTSVAQLVGHHPTKQ